MNTVRRPRHATSHTPGIIGFALAVALACTTLALAAQVTPSAEMGGAEELPSEAGVIILDAAAPSASEGGGDFPAVTFDHDAHSAALMELGKDCSSCHEPYSEDGSGRLDYSFKNTAEKKDGKRGPDYPALKTIYHDGCISCHDDMRSDGLDSGPIEPECRGCHAASALSEAAGLAPRTDGGLTPSLHYLHYTSPDVIGEGADPYDMCGSCHHNGQELSSTMLEYDSCRSCHGTEDVFKRGPAYSEMAHYRCISCHLETAVKVEAGRAESTGPLLCAGCHDAGVRMEYPQFGKLPRLKAGQPYAVIMSEGPGAEPGTQSGIQTAAGGMDPVVFDHALHERANPGCISCHTENLGSYEAGSDGLPRELAVHDLADPASCVGCHESIKTTQPECAGCHTPRTALSRTDCALCHQPLAASLPDSDEARSDLAKRMVNARRTAHAALDLSEVPETVIIGRLANEYNPVEFPHGQIIRALSEGLDESAPAFSYLHNNNSTLCQSCHHNSPASLAPPGCASCHVTERPFGTLAADGRPELKVAYHQQCMSCHQRMDIQYPADTDCIACHTKRTPGS